MHSKQVHMNISSDQKWMYRVEKNFRCCWQCLVTYGEGPEYWRSCGEYDNSYTYVLRVCIGCATHVVGQVTECTLQIGDSPRRPAECKWKKCKSYKDSRAFQKVNGDWEFYPQCIRDQTEYYLDRFDANYVYQKKCDRWD